jgi:molybdopterin molybdotransferase
MQAMLTVSAAQDAILQHAVPLASAARALRDALGCTLAEDIASDIDSPPWDKSLVDGYAVLASDVSQSGATLRVLEEVTAGQLASQSVSTGTAIRIMTGAPLPAGADAVVMIERTQLQGEQVRIDATARVNQNILRQAAAMHRGEVVLRTGQRLRPIEIGLLAETGRTQVPVIKRPRVAVISTGDELVAADNVPAPGQIRNSNGPMLAALAQAAGADVLDLGIARDTEIDLRSKITRGLAAEVLILSGGVSAGVLDLVPSTLQDLGVRQIFHKVNLKPGKPIWFGVSTEQENGRVTLVFGLPGNPVSSLVCFGLFVRMALDRLAGRSTNADAPRSARLTADYTQRDDRHTYFPAVLHYGEAGDEVTLLPWQGSADLRTLAAANALACFASGEKAYLAGQTIPVIPLAM